MKNILNFLHFNESKSIDYKDYTKDIIKILKSKKDKIKYGSENCTSKNCKCDFTFSIVEELDVYALTVECKGYVEYKKSDNTNDTPENISNVEVKVEDLEIIITDEVGTDVELKINFDEIKKAIIDLF